MTFQRLTTAIALMGDAFGAWPKPNRLFEDGRKWTTTSSAKIART